MLKKREKILLFKTLIMILLGYIFGIITIWPGLLSDKSRKCFFNIIKDGSDGNASINTLLSINPNYLMKIKNTKNIYKKILFIGDNCFRDF